MEKVKFYRHIGLQRVIISLYRAKHRVRKLTCNRCYSTFPGRTNSCLQGIYARWLSNKYMMDSYTEQMVIKGEGQLSWANRSFLLARKCLLSQKAWGEIATLWVQPASHSTTEVDPDTSTMEKAVRSLESRALCWCSYNILTHFSTHRAQMMQSIVREFDK